MSFFDFPAAGRREFLGSLGGGAAFSASSQTTERAKPLSIGLIGCGGRGSHLARRTLAVKADGFPVELTAVCDVYQPRLERASVAFSAKPYASSSEMLRDAPLDGVIVATPDRVHVHKALEAVRAGKDVYCEKPLTHWMQFSLLKELVVEARRQKTVFQVGAQWVSDPIWTQAAAQIRKGAIGKVIHAQTGYFRRGDSGERGMPIDDPNAQAGRGLDWDAFQADAPRRDFNVSRFFQWRMYLDYSGGPITDLYPHPLTRLLKAIGAGMPSRVVSVGGRFLYDGGRDVPDTADLLIEYPDGPTVSVLGTIGNSSPIDTVIRGSDGTVTFDQSNGLVFASMPGAKGANSTLDSQRYEDNHLRNWMECMRSRKTPVCDIELGYVVQVPLIMAMRSLIERKVAVWDASNEEIRMV
ncbi:MAG: Gfo/Idh/MocA family protein [Bryobacteraceae bacterium]